MVGPGVTGCFSTLSLENQKGSHLGGISPTVWELGLATGIGIKIFMGLLQNLYKILLLSELLSITKLKGQQQQQQQNSKPAQEKCSQLN